MNGIFSKVLVGVSLAAVLVLAVPLAMMTLSIMHGESPRQLAEQELDQTGAADEPAENEPQSPAFPYPKPVVQPDPGPAGEAEAPAGEEPAAQEEPAPVQRASGRAAKARTQTPVQTAPAAPAEETAQPKNTLPKAVLAPGEAPCMVDGLDGFHYDY